MRSKWGILHPATMFLLLTLGIVLLSWIFDVYGLSVVHPQTGEVIGVQSLLSPEGARWLLRNVITNFTGFTPLGLVVVAMFGIGVAEHSGFIAACMRVSSKRQASAGWVILTVIFLGIISNILGDVGYIILLPIAAALFHSVGLHPVGGIIVAFVSVSCGYSANLLIGTIDPLLSRTTQEAAVAAGINAGAGVLSNYYFLAASTFLIAAVVYVITRKRLLLSLGKYEGKISFDIHKPLSKRERRAAWLAWGVGFIYFVGILWATFSSWGLLRGVTGGLVQSPFIMGILFIVSSGIGIMGTVYGFASRRYRSDSDVVDGLIHPMHLLGVYLVITFFASQMFACLDYSQLNKCIAIAGANFLSSVQPGTLWTLILFIFFVAFINLFMASATTKWTFMAFIFIPVFYKLGISPEETQCAFRIGDSATNAITPFLSYMPLVLTYMQQYDRRSTYITLLKHTWLYSLSILLLWTLLFIGWYLLGLPLGF